VKKMKVSMLKYLLVALLVFSSVPSIAQESPRDNAAWWKSQYGEVTPKEDPLVGRARKIFNRVMAAADKNSKRLPELVIIKSGGDPYAAAIRDGGIILTHGALKLCYKDVDERKGDSRLAFVMGHELSHQAKDDFWHMAAFSAVKEFAADEKIKQALMGYLEKTTDIGDKKPAKDVAKRKELEADAYGMFYMAMAGYDPKMVIDQDGTNFFQDWVSQITGKVAYDDPDHPGPQERAQFVRSQLVAVAEDLSLFSFGVRLYQIGSYDFAIALLDKFREKFPSREVFNNIGLSYYQLAMGTLSSCDKKLPVRFKLSTILDIDTLASGLVTRGKRDMADRMMSPSEKSVRDLPPSCFENEEYRSRMDRSVKRIKEAVEKDPFYLPAKINLSSAHIMLQQYLEAKVILKDALKIGKGNVHVLNNRAIADYLEERESGENKPTGPIAALKKIAGQKPPESSVLYNIATMQLETGNKEWKKNLQAFVNMEPGGIYAMEAKRRLGMKTSDREGSEAKQSPRPPVMTGEVGMDTAKLLKGMRIKDVTIGDNRFEIYEGKDIKLLVVNGSVELIVADVEKPRDVTEFEKIYGKPHRVVEHVSGKTLVYRNFAADTIDGKVRQLIYFDKLGI
jgi:tetratricopeptide (TPR) repeat protein